MRQRKSYPKSFKAQVVHECEQPGVSVAAIAMRHGINSILTLSATTGRTGASGVALLSTYSLGLGLPFLLTAWFTNHFLAQMKRLRRWSRTIHIGAGVILILMGAPW